MLPKFHDIFSQPPKKIKVIDKPLVIADYREKNSLVASELVGLNIDVEFKELKVADYLVRDVAIERKTVSDFLSSMLNKRLVKQLEELQQYPKRLLLIEGIEEQEIYSEDNENGIGVHANAIRGFILSILLKFNVPIIFSKNEEDTAKYISVLAKKKSDESSIRANKKFMSQKEQKQFILEGFPGIGPKSAKKLLKEFKSLHAVFNAGEEELKEILGIKAESFKRIIDEKY